MTNNNKSKNENMQAIIDYFKNNVELYIIDYFRNNIELFNDTLEELNLYTGCITTQVYCTMSTLDEMTNHLNAIDFAEKVLNGYDADSSVDASFNVNRRYFYYDKNDNLVSTDHRTYINDRFNHLNPYIIELMQHFYNKGFLSMIDDNTTLKPLFDLLTCCNLKHNAL